MKNPTLHQVLKQAEAFKNKKEQRLLAIFDLDSTLFDVDPRIHAILKEFSTTPELMEKYPRACRVIASVEKLPRSYHLKQYMFEFGLDQETPEFYKEIFEFWRTRFFSSPYLKYDRPYPGAVEFVQALMSNGATLEYLTGRDTQRLEEGTRKSLVQWNFPLNDVNARLIMKPNHEMNDAEYKRDILSLIEEAQGPVWFFENELENIDLVSKHAPHVNIVFFDSVHSGKGAPLAPHIPVIQDFLLK